MDESTLAHLIRVPRLLRKFAAIEGLIPFSEKATREIAKAAVKFMREHSVCPTLADMEYAFQGSVPTSLESLYDMDLGRSEDAVWAEVVDETQRARLSDFLPRAASVVGAPKLDCVALHNEMREIAEIGGEGFREISMVNASRWGGLVQKRIFRGRVPTGIGQLDALLYGGLSVGELSFFMAPPGTGKTGILVNTMAAGMLAGYDALFISLELTEVEILERVSRRLMGVTRAYEREHPEFLKLVERQMKSVDTSSRIVYAPPGKFSIEDLKDLVNDVRETAGLDAIYIDYVDKMRMGKRWREQRLEIRQLVESLRSYAGTDDLAIVTVSQTNRKGLEKAVLSGKFVGEGFAKYEAADVFFAYLPLGEEQDECRFTALKLRDMGGVGKSVVARRDYARMLISDDPKMIPREGDAPELGDDVGSIDDIQF